MAKPGSTETTAAGEADGRDFGRERDALLDEIDAEMAATSALTGRAALHPRVRDALASVPRHEFVGETDRRLAYYNYPLPIGHGQTISQPYIVALMTDLLDPRPQHVVLEVGTGSGYQAAVLSRLVRRVYSIEVVVPLADRAARTLARLGYDNVEVRAGDGALGWPEHAPFDGVIVTAEAARIPPALIEQLKPGGRLVMPVGDPFGQDLVLVTKSPEGKFDQRRILPVSFVPLTSGK